MSSIKKGLFKDVNVLILGHILTDWLVQSIFKAFFLTIFNMYLKDLKLCAYSEKQIYFCELLFL